MLAFKHKVEVATGMENDSRSDVGVAETPPYMSYTPNSLEGAM